MNISPELYSDMTRRASPKSNSRVNVPAAFVTGGSICVIGQLILSALEGYGISHSSAALWTSVILIVSSSLLTGPGLYGRLARFAGAGTLVPITGFSNAISSAAIEAMSEGFILGVGTKIFTIAGPVILYGSAASVLYGIIYYLIM